MKEGNHLENGALIRYLDGEVPEEECARVRSHVAVCLPCRQRRDELARLSFRVDAVVSAKGVGDAGATRAKLAAAVACENAAPPQVMKRFAWGMAIAATLAAGIIVAPRPVPRPAAHLAQTAPRSTQVTTFDVNGESFVALPYSNPELPMNAPRIVEMQVPVSSLAVAGIFFQPVASGSGDRTVLANVLLGMDGQPLGVHVLSAE